MEKTKEEFKFVQKADVSKEKVDIESAKEELKKLEAIIQEKELAIRLKQEQELAQKLEQKYELAKTETEEVAKQIEYFKHAHPFNQNMSFMGALMYYYDQVDRYQESEYYETTDPVLYGKAREMMVKVRRAGKKALDSIGSQAHRVLLQTYDERFKDIDKTLTEMNKILKALTKKVNKLE